MKLIDVTQVTTVRIDMTPEEAKRLYDNISSLLQIAGVDRKKLDIASAYELYDTLYTSTVIMNRKTA